MGRNITDIQPVALVTGASSGIGAEVARLLAMRGCRTILVARRMDRLNLLASELSNVAPCVGVQLDLSDPTSLDGRLRDIFAEYGKPDIVFNNAGYGLYKPFLDTTSAESDQLWQVLYRAPAAIIRATLPAMLANRRGHIINIASISAAFGPYGHGPYAAAKAALITLTQSLACEHQGSGVHFSYVLPGVVRTEFFDDPSYANLQHQIRRHGLSASLVAQRIVRLLDRPRLATYVPRAYRMIDIIRAVSPRLALKMVAGGSRPKVR
ncbi:MAG: SDR family NAD(P)-dependent oxidoreductase [Phycisphaeraceae bacterium]|nr:SDR family NAD(P)-dependent oxidoreductase [Phycisphaeraceae bacterium]